MGQVYSHLSEEGRRVVRIEMGNGAGVRRMAMVPGRHASTAGREIRRDTWFPSSESESYRPCRPKRLRTGPWTGRAADGAGARPAAGVRAAAASRCARRSANAHTGRTTGAVSASGRPTASSARGRSLHTEVGRRTRFPMAAIVPDETAAASVAAQKAMFSRLPAAARTGATHDDGTELARHAELRDEPGMATYSADPHSSWRRGGNENRNGMIRRHPPKRTPIAPSMAREPQEIVDETGNRPMRVLGCRTPAEAFADELLESAENKDAALTNR